MTLILTHSEISTLLDRDDVRKAVQMAFAGVATSECHNPAPQAVRLPGDGAALPMAASGRDRVAVKLLCDIPSNRDRGLPTQRSTILLTNAITGECLAILDGRAITAIRTAAASAVATDHLAPQSASVLGLVGAGNLAIEHTYAIAAVRDLDEIVVWSRSDATFRRYQAATESLGIRVSAGQTPEAVLAAADIVCTLTPSREPVVYGAWFRPGHHINAVGAPPRRDHREIDSAGMKRARVVVDSYPTVMAKSGGVLLAIAEGAITEADVWIELGQVVAGLTEGRTADDQITLFESVGIGLQDLVTADLVLAHASARGLGKSVDLAR
ncbi:MAG: ornithine cyclodeaminase family protein [Mycobacterium sp.]